jgi:hypothetical protein
MCIMLSTAPAAAERDTAAAQAMFDQARDAMKRGDLAQACPKFAESHRLDPQPGTLANLAVCEEKRGAVASAWTHAREVIDQLGPGDDRVPALKALVGRAAKRLPRLTIRLAAGAPKGARVRRDDVELGDASLGESLPVDPGDHTIVVVAPGRKDTSTVVTLVEGKMAQVEVSAGDELTGAGVPTAMPVAEKERPVGPAEPASTSGRKTLGYSVGGVGLVGVGVAAVTGFVLLGKQSNVKAADCDKTSGVCRGPNASEGTAAASSGQSLLPVYYGSLAVGVVGLAIGAYFIFTDGDASVAVRVSPSGGAVEGRF